MVNSRSSRFIRQCFTFPPALYLTRQIISYNHINSARRSMSMAKGNITHTKVSLNPFSPTLLLIVANMSLPKRSVTYCSNPPFQFFDIRALWCPTLSVRVPKCQKIITGGLDQYGPEHSEVSLFDITALKRVN